jgi:hypothetical protein
VINHGLQRDMPEVSGAAGCRHREICHWAEKVPVVQHIHKVRRVLVPVLRLKVADAAAGNEVQEQAESVKLTSSGEMA